ncbi:MAG: glycosyltransferase family 4 protein [Anaerolineales bacterium]
MEAELTLRKVAVVAYSAPPYSTGGVASAHFNLFRLLQRSGLEARLFTFGEAGYEDGLDVVRRGTPRWLNSLLQKIIGLLFALIQPGKSAYQTMDILKSIVGATRMSREIKKYSPNVIVLSDHGAPGLMLMKPKGTKIVLVSHHNPARFLSIADGNYSRFDTQVALGLEQRVFSKVDAVVCPSAYMKRWFEKSYKYPGPVSVIPNVIDEKLLLGIQPLDLRAHFNLEQNSIVIYMPSAGSYLKGAGFILELIREIVAQSKNAIGFYVPGDIPSGLLDQVSELPDKARLCFTGPLSYEEHIGNVKTCSFGISPSLIENYSMALLEAVHCGVPMLAFETGGNADIIRYGENGYLVPEGDIKSLSKLATQLLESGRLKALQEKTMTYSQLHLSSQTALDAYLEMMKSL